MRLIDADKFKQQVEESTMRDNLVVAKSNAICELIDAQPTAYDVDEVIKRLKEATKTMMPVLDRDEAIKIVLETGK